MLSLQHVSKNWMHTPLQEKGVLNDFSLDIQKGDFVAFLGANGVGKTTLFNIIAGLDKEYDGTVLREESVRVGYVFQNYRQSLFPWRTVFENIAYPLTLLGATPFEQKRIVESRMSEYNIALDLTKYPYQLSGGQQQIVAVMRALIADPHLVLLDEPFSAIDYESTAILMRIIQAAWKAKRFTALLISHDIDEALLLAQRILLFGKNPLVVLDDLTHDASYPRTLTIMQEESFMNLKRRVLEIFINKTLIQSI